MYSSNRRVYETLNRGLIISAGIIIVLVLGLIAFNNMRNIFAGEENGAVSKI